MIVLRGGTLIDGTGRAPVRDATIVVDDGRIERVTTGPDVNGPAGAEVIDVSGRTVLPGLIDCHDHLASHGYGLATRWGLDEPASTAHLRTGARARARRSTSATRRSATPAGSTPASELAVERGAGPRGRASCRRWRSSRRPAGIGDRVSPSGHELLRAGSIPRCRAASPMASDAVRDVVRTMVRAGADVIKSATTGGASSRAGHGPQRRRVLRSTRCARWSTSRTRSAAG